MKYAVTIITCCVLLSLLTSRSNAQDLQKIIPVKDDSVYYWLNEYHVPAVAIGIIENHRIKSIRTYGDLRRGTRLPETALWNVASLAKPVTAMTVLALVNERKWDMDEPVSHYWTDPDIAGDPLTQTLTTRILLSHSSGFPNWRYGAPGGKLFFRFRPGSKMGYSGEGYEYLRHALESRFGHPLQQLAGDNLFVRAQMHSTRYGWDLQQDSSLFVPPFDTAGNQIHSQRYAAANAADWLITTIGDYTRFGLYTINGGGISGEVYRSMHTIQTHFDTTAAQRSNGMGLGWQVIKDLPGNEFLLAHSGSDPGLRTYALLLPVSGRGIVLFTNGDNGDKVISHILKASLQDLTSYLSQYMREFR